MISSIFKPGNKVFGSDGPTPGGGLHDATSAFGIWGDFIVYTVESSGRTATYNVPQTDAFGNPLPPLVQPRFGDYLSVRQGFPDPSLFAAFGYAVQADAANSSKCSGNTSGGCKFDPLYVLFGRPPAPAIH